MQRIGEAVQGRVEKMVADEWGDTSDSDNEDDGDDDDDDEQQQQQEEEEEEEEEEDEDEDEDEEDWMAEEREAAAFEILRKNAGGREFF